MNELRLNLGAGYMDVPGYISLDTIAYLPDTVVCRFPPLDYADGSVADIFCGHCLEHIPPWDLLPLLTECFRVLVSGGTLTVIVPDERKARISLLSRRLTLDAYAEVLGGGLVEQHTPITADVYATLIGGGQVDDMPHWTIWNPARLRGVLDRAGFVVNADYRWKEDDRLFDQTAFWQCGAQGVKP